MKTSLHLGKVSGIKIRVHWTFLLLIGWIVFLEISRGNDMGAIMWSIFFVLVLFICVILHELGHALTAQKYNIGTRQITLLPIGGVASLKSMPEDPKEELMVALAGPAVNVVLAILLYLIVPVETFLDLDPDAMEEAMSSINSGNFLFFLLSANIMLAVFNMLPAFPMDGGRVLRALLSMKMDRVSATQVASRLGQGVAFLFFFVGLLYNPILILIGLFVYFGAQGENVMIQQLNLLRDHKVRDAMMTHITNLNPDDTLDRVIDIILAGTERDFVVAGNGTIEGVLLQSDIMQAIKSKNTGLQVKDIMTKEFEVLEVDQDLTDIYRKIRSGKVHFFPVEKEGRLAGALDMENINEFLTFRASLDF